MKETERNDRIVGSALIGASFLSMLAMAHHPTSLAAGALIGIVHGVMILVVGVLTFGFAQVARRLGLERPAVLAGLIAYAIGAVANIGAATLNGFVAPALAAHEPALGHDLFDLVWTMNQALAKLGVVAVGIGYACWALALWRQARPVAVLGLVAGGVPALLLIAGLIDMHLHAAMLVYAAQALWAILIGWLLLRGRLTTPGD